MELNRVAHAVYSPTQCALCMSVDGPFVDTGIDLDPYGHIYICAANDHRSGCVRQIGRLDHMIDDTVVSEAMRRIQELDTRVHELEQELEEAQVVPLKEVIEYLRDTPRVEEVV